MRTIPLDDNEEIVRWSPDDQAFSLAFITRHHNNSSNYSSTARRDLRAPKKAGEFSIHAQFDHPDYEGDFTY